MFQVRSRAREHDNTHCKARKDQNNIDYATDQWRGYALKDFIVVARTVIGPELQGHDTKDDVEDTQDGNADQALRSERKEVLQKVLTTGKARTDDDANVSECDREVLFRHSYFPSRSWIGGRGALTWLIGASVSA